MDQFEILKKQLKLYLPENQISLIEIAYDVALKAHKGQIRSTGEPYITHPTEVARILADLQMDYQSIIAALLHDTIEDTSIDKEKIKSIFDDKIAELVDGVSKLDRIKFESNIEAQAVNLRKMMLAMSNDIRVILIKLADRLHNMRTMKSLIPERQKRIAIETLEIYAPIAHRLGMHKFRMEFEDLGFEYLYPVRHKILKDSVRKARGNRKRLVSELENSIKHRLEQENVLVEKVFGREKHLYSLYKKMKNKDLSLSDIMDIYAVRIIVPSVDNCYRVLGVVHNLYKPIHKRFKDYIAVPKINGYQSLHTTVLGQHGIPVEIQIRTKEMDFMAEDGIAAHWIYKSKNKDVDITEFKAKKWLQGLLDIQKSSGNSEEFLENVKIDLYPHDIYVFTPLGDIWSLPQGATPIDFAYAIHTDIGNACIAVKIDRRFMPLSTILTSGQTVEIITSEKSEPNPAWLGFVVTGKARSNIRHWLKSQKASESRTLGLRLLKKALKSLSFSIDDIKKEKFNEILLEYKLDVKDKLFEEIGLGNYIAPIVARKLVRDLLSENDTLCDDNFKNEGNVVKVPLAIKGTEGIVVSYGKCCHPIPDDQIVGFLSAGRGIVIHRKNCSNVAKMSRNQDKHVFVEWANDVKGEFKVELKVDVINERGVLATVANIISSCDANIENVQIDERDSRHNVLSFLLHVKDRVHLAEIMKNLRQINFVTKVGRTK